VGLKLNGTHLLLAYVDDNVIDSIATIKKSTESLTDASSEVGLEINVEKTKYMLLSYHQKGQDDIKITDGLKMCHSSGISLPQKQIKI
jgi:hypothetical protein